MDNGMTVYMVVKEEMYDESNYKETIYKGFSEDEAKLHMYAEAAKLSIMTGLPITEEFESPSVGTYYFNILRKTLLFK